LGGIGSARRAAAAARIPSAAVRFSDGRFGTEEGVAIAIEVELTPKPIERTVAIMLELPESGRWCQAVHYIVSDASRAVVLRAAAMARVATRAAGVDYRVYTLRGIEASGFEELEIPEAA
jgi:hypothetical protein